MSDWDALTRYHDEARRARLAAVDAGDERTRAAYLEKAEHFSSLAWAIIDESKRRRM